MRASSVCKRVVGEGVEVIRWVSAGSMSVVSSEGSETDRMRASSVCKRVVGEGVEVIRWVSAGSMSVASSEGSETD